MASSRSSPPADGRDLSVSLNDALAELAARIPARAHGLRIAVALSGGRDSMALLDALADVAAPHRLALSAVHVHHGLSRNADHWASFCAEACNSRGLPFTLLRVQVQRAAGKSLEASARTERYRALAAVDADAVMLAHHADDQAETVLLQLLRGSGPRGLAAMPAARTGDGPVLVRPWLEVPRAAINVYAQARGLQYIEDESNADRALKRNLLRHEVAPLLAAAFPGYPHTLVRAAAHSAEAAQLLDELAALDARDVCAADREGALAIDRAALIGLAQSSLPRARNLVRWFLRQHDLSSPSTARLAAMLQQFVEAAPGSRVRLAHGGAELGIFRGRIVVHAPPVARFNAVWSGEASLALPHGILEFTPACGEGIAADALERACVTVRQRAGRERLRLLPDRSSRSVKRLLYDAGIAPWLRASLPFVYCGDALAAVAGLGVDTAFRAAPGVPGVALTWRPRRTPVYGDAPRS